MSKRLPDGRVNVMAVLYGAAVKRELKSAESKIHHNQFVDDEDRQNTIDEVAACTAARGLWIAGLPKALWDEVEKNVDTIVMYGLTVPLVHRQHITLKWCSMQVRAGHFAEWLKALDGTPCEHWHVKSPCFGACWGPWEDSGNAVAISGPKEDLAEEGKVPDTDQRTIWLQAIFDSGFLALMNTSATFDSLFAACAQLITLLVTKTDMPAELQPQIIMTCKIIRGFIALISPIPGVHGSSLADVQFISSEPGTVPGVIAEFPITGRLIASKLRKEPWVSMASEYRKYVGPTQTHGDAFHRCAEAVESLSKHASIPEEKLELWETTLSTVAADLPTWRESLRTGATDGLEKGVAKLVSMDVAEMQRAHKEDPTCLADLLANCAELKKVLDACNPDMVHDAVQLLANTMTQWQRASRAASLVTALDTLEKTPNDSGLFLVSTLLADLSPTLEPEMHAKVSAACASVLDWLSSGTRRQCTFKVLAGVLLQVNMPGKEAFAEIAGVVGDFQQEVVNSNNGDRLYLRQLQSAADAARKVLDKYSTNQDPVLLLFTQSAKEQYLEDLESYKTSYVMTLSVCVHQMEEAFGKCKAVAGGAANGGKWFEQGGVKEDGSPEDIMEVWKRTLGTMNTQQIQKQVEKMTTERSNYTTTKAAFHPSFPGMDVDTETGAIRVLEPILEAETRATITKFEHLMCQAIQRGGKNLQNRLNAFTAQLSADVKKDWKTLVCVPLRELVEGTLTLA